MLSNANEKANLKDVFPKYILGVILIGMCATIASTVANISSGAGDNTASGLVDKGFEIGKLDSEHSYDGNLGEYVVKFLEKNNRILVYAPEDATIYYKDETGDNPMVTALSTVEGQNFKRWFIIVTEEGKAPYKMYYENNIFYAEGADGIAWTDAGADTKYEMYAIYEGAEYIEDKFKDIQWFNKNEVGTPLDPVEPSEPLTPIPEPDF